MSGSPFPPAFPVAERRRIGDRMLSSAIVAAIWWCGFAVGYAVMWLAIPGGAQ